MDDSRIFFMAPQKKKLNQKKIIVFHFVLKNFVSLQKIFL